MSKSIQSNGGVKMTNSITGLLNDLATCMRRRYNASCTLGVVNPSDGLPKSSFSTSSHATSIAAHHRLSQPTPCPWLWHRRPLPWKPQRNLRPTTGHSSICLTCTANHGEFTRLQSSYFLKM